MYTPSSFIPNRLSLALLAILALVKDDAFQSLLYARDQLLRQLKNNAEINAKARFERIAF